MDLAPNILADEGRHKNFNISTTITRPVQVSSGPSGEELFLVKNFFQKSGHLFCVSLIRAYQLFLSPLLPPTCRYTPTCSQYAIEALERHGLWRGLYRAIRRILRCHPFKKGGFDPVDC